MPSKWGSAISDQLFCSLQTAVTSRRASSRSRPTTASRPITPSPRWRPSQCPPIVQVSTAGPTPTWRLTAGQAPICCRTYASRRPAGRIAACSRRGIEMTCPVEQSISSPRYRRPHWQATLVSFHSLCRALFMWCVLILKINVIIIYV